MNVLAAIFEIIAIVFTIGFQKVSEISQSVIDQVKTHWQRYLHALKVTLFFLITVPTLLIILGIIFNSSILIGLAGIIVCLAVGTILLSFYPFILLLQLLLSFKKGFGHSSDEAEPLARRYLHAVITVLLLICLINLLIILLPWRVNPGMIIFLALASLIIFLLSLRYGKEWETQIKEIAESVVFVVLVSCVFALFLPDTMDAFRDSIKSMDETISGAILSGKGIIDYNPDIDSPVKELPVSEPGKGGWTKFNLSAATADALPTNIYVKAGDIVEFRADGEATFSIREPDRFNYFWDGRTKEKYKVKSGPDGTWPAWLTQDNFKNSFSETTYKRGWNLLCRLVIDSTTSVLIPIGTKKTWVATSDGSLWLMINRIKTSGDMGKGYYKVKIKVSPRKA